MSIMHKMRALLCAGALTIMALTPAVAPAQTRGDTLTLDSAIAIALEANPQIAAARFRADAAGERVPQAGALPDPTLSLGLVNRVVNNFGTGARMSMNSIQLTQRFPWPGRLGFSKERARHLATARRLESNETELKIVARVKSSYFQLAYLDRAIEIMEETRELLRSFFDVALTRYAVGGGLQQDVLQAQVTVAQMTEDITVAEQNRVAMAARLNATLGRPAPALVGPVELPEASGDIISLDSLMALAVRDRPALAAARERALAAGAGYRAARRSVYPDLTLTVGYGQRPQFSDLVTVMVGISIPIWARSRQLPQRREMRAMQSMEEARELDLYNETYAAIAELRADAVRASNLATLYSTAVLPQASAAVESAMSAYRVGRVDYMTLVQNEMTVNRYEIESVRLTADYHRALAELEALVGRELGGYR